MTYLIYILSGGRVGKYLEKSVNWAKIRMKMKELGETSKLDMNPR